VKLFLHQKQFRVILLAASLFGAGFTLPTSARAAAPKNIDDFRREVLAARVSRVVDARLLALAHCAPSASEAPVLSQARALRATYKNYAASGTDGLIALLDAYGETAKIKAASAQSNSSACAKQITNADSALSAVDRKKFAGLEKASLFANLNPLGGISPLTMILLELDPWCASGVQANFNGARDGNPCFAGEIPILAALRDSGNKIGRSYFGSAAETDSFLAKLDTAASSGNRVIDLEKLFSAKTDPRDLLAIMTYLYAAGTSELGWVDGFGESFWRSTLDQGSSGRTALAVYSTWLGRKDRFVVIRKETHARGLELRLFGHGVERWNHHEFISAFLACNYRARGEKLLARTVPEALGVAYESRDFVSHMKEHDGWKASEQNFITDVSRHEEGGHFGRLACASLDHG
jgi:hypothetical protein